jgi:1-aminocyclopropane-1-carboxylate deaminase/D-cysteine desulfhydrase-like pyridoxal-dependent ACC family enzyme
MERAAPLTLCELPTPIERIERIAALHTPRARAAELWVKRDDRTHPIYGGNKVRKLEWLLADARARGARRIVTVGAVGSHHVLATTYFGRREGFDVEAVLVPQPRTQHVVDVLRAGIALGLRPVPVRSWAAAVPALLARLADSGSALGGGSRFVPLGGSSLTGTMGYVSAARELAAQVRAGKMPEPDVCVVALGSGGTAAGLAAGFQAEGMKTRVVGVCVSRPAWALLVHSRLLARGCVKSSRSDRLNRLRTDPRFLGKGYGHATPEGEEGARVAAAAGLVLDPTYTAKAFASALWHLRARRGRVVLYWHTLSSAPLGPLLEGAPSENELEPRLRRLLETEALTETLKEA